MATHHDWKMGIVMLYSKFFKYNYCIKIISKFILIETISGWRRPKIIFDGTICISPSAIYTDSHKIFHGTISYKNYQHRYACVQTHTHAGNVYTIERTHTLRKKR